LNAPAPCPADRVVADDPEPSRSLDLFARSIRLRWELPGDVGAILSDAAMGDPTNRAENRTRLHDVA
jgi:hypothetical protein